LRKKETELWGRGGKNCSGTSLWRACLAWVDCSSATIAIEFRWCDSPWQQFLFKLVSSPIPYFSQNISSTFSRSHPCINTNNDDIRCITVEAFLLGKTASTCSQLIPCTRKFGADWLVRKTLSESFESRVGGDCAARETQCIGSLAPAQFLYGHKYADRLGSS
jgi:hypothetical protein